MKIKKPWITLVLVLAMIITVILLGGCSGSMNLLNKFPFLQKQKTKTDGLTSYAQELTGIKLDDCAKEEEGEVQISASGDYAYICLKLKPDSIAVLTQRLDEAGKKAFNGEIIFYGFDGHELAKQMASQEAVAWYTFFHEGKNKAKTRSIELYLTRDESGEEYLYLFG